MIFSRESKPYPVERVTGLSSPHYMATVSLVHGRHPSTNNRYICTPKLNKIDESEKNEKGEGHKNRIPILWNYRKKKKIPVMVCRNAR